jgi:hypothetical protein
MGMVGVMYFVGGSAMFVQVTCKRFAVQGISWRWLSVWCRDVTGFNDTLLSLHHYDAHNSGHLVNCK